MNNLRTQLTDGVNISIQERTDAEVWEEWDRIVEQWSKSMDPFEAVRVKGEEWDACTNNT